jgi:hypothetical protein
LVFGFLPWTATPILNQLVVKRPIGFEQEPFFISQVNANLEVNVFLMLTGPIRAGIYVRW